eukprot:566482-Lingulodinium_polyedra.AAC.1
MCLPRRRASLRIVDNINVVRCRISPASSHAFICGVPVARAWLLCACLNLLVARARENQELGSRRVTDVSGLPFERKVQPIPPLASP